MSVKAWDDENVDPIADIKDAVEETRNSVYTPMSREAEKSLRDYMLISLGIDPIVYDDLNAKPSLRQRINRRFKYRYHRWTIRWVGFVYQHSICNGNDMIGHYWWWRLAPFEIRKHRPLSHRFRTIPSPRGNLS